MTLRKRLRLLLAAAGAVLASGTPAAAGLRLVESGPGSIDLVLEVEPGIGSGGRGIAAPGLPRGAGPGGIDLPYAAALVAAPPGARLRLSVVPEASEDFSGVEPGPADSHAVVLDPRQVPALAHTQPLGRLRGTPAHRLRIFPWQVDPVSGRARVHRRLKVRIDFLGGGSSRTAALPDPRGDFLRAAFVNPPPPGWTAPRPAARPAAPAWYDPARPWIKVLVRADGVYRIAPGWKPLSPFGPDSIDPRTFRLFHAGAEIPLAARGSEDGSFDPGDDILFYGRYRRAVTAGRERDHESEYGPEEVYWLTWGGAAGRRFEEREVTPERGYPERRWYLHSAHHEIDRSFDQLGFSEDPLLDRWFWQPPQDALTATHPDKPSSQTFAGDITALYDEEEYEARVEVALQGRTGAGFGQHHTVVHFNWTGAGSRVLEEAYWAGQVPRVIDAAVPSGWLRPRNRVLLQGYADRIKVDQIWFNWFRVTYRRRFDARPGFLAAPTEAAPGGHRIAMEGFRHPEVTLLDAAAGALLTGAEAASAAGAFRVTFEDAPASPPLYVAADSLSLGEPRGLADRPSDWRSGAHGADYVIISPPGSSTPRSASPATAAATGSGSRSSPPTTSTTSSASAASSARPWPTSSATPTGTGSRGRPSSCSWGTRPGTTGGSTPAGPAGGSCRPATTWRGNAGSRPPTTTSPSSTATTCWPTSPSGGWPSTPRPRPIGWWTRSSPTTRAPRRATGAAARSSPPTGTPRTSSPAPSTPSRRATPSPRACSRCASTRRTRPRCRTPGARPSSTP